MHPDDLTGFPIDTVFVVCTGSVAETFVDGMGVPGAEATLGKNI
jgi:hypothetical protein